MQASSLKPVNEVGSEIDSVQPVNIEGMHYVEAKSYLMIEIELHRPLIRKKDSAELAIRLVLFYLRLNILETLFRF